MQPKTEELLSLLLWSADALMRPTFRNLTDSYESWAYRNGLMRQVAVLEKQQLVERSPGALDDRVYRLTDQGRLHALGGRDPAAQWSRAWDERWRLVLFDIPTAQNTHRARLRRYLRNKGFGYLQNSVWTHPILWSKNAKSSPAGRLMSNRSFCWRRGLARENPTPISSRALGTSNASTVAIPGI
jgi:hypothetical protein